MKVRVDLTGRIFGRLTVLYRTERKSSQGFMVYWMCMCKCGELKEVHRCKLTGGGTKSCGCLNTEQRKTNCRTHGMSGRTELTIWRGMLSRCYDKRVEKYPIYGGRGIRVCRRWRNSFLAFYEDMGDRPSPNHSIDRINNDGDYSPENCRWATPKEQSYNRRKTLRFTWEGIARTADEWSIITGIPSGTIRYRIRGYGWTVEKALTTPVRPWGPGKPMRRTDASC